eukprot:gene9455-6637_t
MFSQHIVLIYILENYLTLHVSSNNIHYEYELIISERASKIFTNTCQIIIIRIIIIIYNCILKEKEVPDLRTSVFRSDKTKRQNFLYCFTFELFYFILFRFLMIYNVAFLSLFSACFRAISLFFLAFAFPMSDGSSRHDNFIAREDEQDPEKNFFPEAEDDSLEGHHQPSSGCGCCDSVTSLVSTVIPKGGILATVFSTCATCIGGGILGLPSAFEKSGAIASVIWLAFIAVETAYSLRLLAITAEITGMRSYEQIAHRLLGTAGRYLVAGMRFVNCLGSMIAYVKSIGNLLRPILEGANAPSFLLENRGFRLLQAVLWLFFFFPLTIPREVNALRYVSTAGVLGMIFFSFCVLAHFCTDGLSNDVDLVTSGNRAVEGLGVFLFTYVCQINVVEIFFEMQPRGVGRFSLCAALSMFLCGCLYTITGLFGYLEFGNSVGSSVLLLYNPMSEPQIFISYVFVFVKLAASYGLFGNATRSSMYHAVGWEPMKVNIWIHLLFTAIVKFMGPLGDPLASHWIGALKCASVSQG